MKFFVFSLDIWRLVGYNSQGLENDSLAQSVEHLTFNQGVRGSNPRWVTKEPVACNRLFCFA